MEDCGRCLGEGGWADRDGYINPCVEESNRNGGMAYIQKEIKMFITEDTLLHIKCMTSKTCDREYHWDGWLDHLLRGTCKCCVPVGSSNEDSIRHERTLKSCADHKSSESCFDWEDFDPSHPNEQFYLLRHDPVLCGLIACRCLNDLEEWGVQQLNSQKSGVAMAHLYNALRQQDPPVPIWTDLESIVGRGERNIFGGKGAVTAKQYLNHLRLADGTSLRFLIPHDPSMHKRMSSRRSQRMGKGAGILSTAGVIQKSGSCLTTKPSADLVC